MFSNKLNYKIINLASLMLLLYIGLSNVGLWWKIIAKILSILAPFIAGFAIAYAFTPLVKWLEKKGLPRTGSLLIVIVGIVVIVLGILLLTIPMLYDQLSLLLKTLGEVFTNINTKFHINIGDAEIKITDYLNDMLKGLSTVGSSATMDMLNKSIDIISKVIIGFVAFAYFLIDMDKIRLGIRELLGKNKRAIQYIKLMDVEITNYLKGLEIFMVIQFFEYSFLFLIIGHPNWFILGLLACVTTVIPYFGGLITNLIAIVLASVVSFPLVVMTTIICLIFPQLDGYVISPKVYGKTNNVNPLITIMAVSIGGTLAGVTGIIIALPIYLLIRTTYHFFKQDLMKGMGRVKDTME